MKMMRRKRQTKLLQTFKAACNVVQTGEKKSQMIRLQDDLGQFLNTRRKTNLCIQENKYFTV